MRSKKQWIQCELAELPGSEPWVLVRHRAGSFRVPYGTSIESVMEGVAKGWNSGHRHVPQGGMVTISKSAYGTLKADADQWGGLSVDQRNELLLSMGDPGRGRGNRLE